MTVNVARLLVSSDHSRGLTPRPPPHCRPAPADLYGSVTAYFSTYWQTEIICEQETSPFTMS